MSETRIPDDIACLKYAEAQQEMEKLIRKIDAGGMSVEDIAECVERSCFLAMHCRNILTSIEKRILLLTGELQQGGVWTDFESNDSSRNNQAPDDEPPF